MIRHPKVAGIEPQSISAPKLAASSAIHCSQRPYSQFSVGVRVPLGDAVRTAAGVSPLIPIPGAVDDQGRHDAMGIQQQLVGVTLPFLLTVDQFDFVCPPAATNAMWTTMLAAPGAKYNVYIFLSPVKTRPDLASSARSQEIEYRADLRR